MKSRNSTKYTQPLAWLDLVFNLMMSFAFLFVLSYILINVTKKDDEMKKPKAEMLVIMTWPDGAVEDIDLWLKLPNNSTISFSHKESPLISLERDDRGLASDWVQDPNTGLMVINPTNKEIITFRGLPPGRYQVSVHYYSSMGGAATSPLPNPPTPPYPVKVEILKLNPTVMQAFVKEVTVEQKGVEVPVVMFTVEADGSVTNFRTENLEKFVPLATGVGVGGEGYDEGP